MLDRNYMHIYQTKIYNIMYNFSKSETLISYKQGVKKSIFLGRPVLSSQAFEKTYHFLFLLLYFQLLDNFF